MRIASGSALFVACLVVASSANGKSENTSAILPPLGGGRREASLGNPRKRGLYGDLSIDGAAENMQMRKVTPVLDRPSSHLEQKALEPASDHPQEPLDNFSQNSTGNLSEPLEMPPTKVPAPTPHSRCPRETQTQVLSDQFAFPLDVYSLDPVSDVHVYPPLYSGPPNTPLMGSAALFLSNPPLSRALAHCSTSLSIWSSENEEAAHLVDPPGISKSSTIRHTCAFPPISFSGDSPMASRTSQVEGMCECRGGTNNSVGTHIVDGGWVSNLVQTLSS